MAIDLKKPLIQGLSPDFAAKKRKYSLILAAVATAAFIIGALRAPGLIDVHTYSRGDTYDLLMFFFIGAVCAIFATRISRAYHADGVYRFASILVWANLLAIIVAGSIKIMQV